MLKALILTPFLLSFSRISLGSWQSIRIPDVPDTPEEWLDQFNTFSIYEILPQIIELWGLNVEQQVASKKNITAQSGK
jgi:hypothetical protein